MNNYLEKGIQKNNKLDTESFLLMASPPVLRELRESRGIKRNDFAKMTGVHEDRLARIENKSASKISMADLTIYAAGLDIDRDYLYAKITHTGNIKCIRSSLQKPLAVSVFPSGSKLIKLLMVPNFCFVGILNLVPQSSFPVDHVPGGKNVFFYVLEGELLINISGEGHDLNKGNSFSFPIANHCEIKNPNPSKSLSAFLVSFPQIPYFF